MGVYGVAINKFYGKEVFLSARPPVNLKPTKGNIHAYE